MRKNTDRSRTYAFGVAQTSESAVSQVSKPAGHPTPRDVPSGEGWPADKEVGDTADSEVCATTAQRAVPTTLNFYVSLTISRPRTHIALTEAPFARDRNYKLKTEHYMTTPVCSLSVTLVFLLTPIPALHADPHLTSWLTRNSGR